MYEILLSAPLPRALPFTDGTFAEKNNSGILAVTRRYPDSACTPT
jgi:hypothetical protein